MSKKPDIRATPIRLTHRFLAKKPARNLLKISVPVEITATPTARSISPALTLTRDIPPRCNTGPGLAPRSTTGNGCALKKRRPLNGSDPGVTSGPSSELAAPPLLTSYIRYRHEPGGPERPRPGKRAAWWEGLPTLRDATPRRTAGAARRRIADAPPSGGDLVGGPRRRYVQRLWQA